MQQRKTLELPGFSTMEQMNLPSTVTMAMLQSIAFIAPLKHIAKRRMNIITRLIVFLARLRT
jgi:hypothetical protein